MPEPIHIDAIGWCFLCQRENVPLRRYRQHDGTQAIACADEHDCAAAFARLPRFRRRRRSA